MQRYVVARWAAGVALGLALTGCSVVDGGQSSQNPSGGQATQGQAAAPTLAPAARATVVARPAQQATAVGQDSANGASSGVAQAAPSAQQATATPLPESFQQQLDAQEQVVANIFKRAGPSVVRIETGQGLGSGFLVDQRGYIISNNHVVASSTNGRVLVSFTGLFQTVGQVIGTDPDADVAVIKVDKLPQGVTPVELGDSAQVQVGQLTVAIGNPLGQDRTVTSGIVSALGRTIQESDEQGQQNRYSIGGAIQTDAAINPGNSGGPLFNSRGQVIGMNTAILSRSGTSAGIGFAVPVNLIKKVSAALIEGGRYDHPYLGVGFSQDSQITTYAAEQRKLPSTGVLIAPSQSDPNSPAAQAGIRSQVILTAINGTEITSSDDVISYLELNTKPGDTVTLSVVGGDGQKRDVQVKLGSRPRTSQ